MTTFMYVTIVLTTVFVTLILIVDHVERSRMQRISDDPFIQRWMESTEEERLFANFLQRIGVSEDSTDEDIVQAMRQHERVQKILSNMK